MLSTAVQHDEQLASVVLSRTLETREDLLCARFVRIVRNEERDTTDRLRRFTATARAHVQLGAWPARVSHRLSVSITRDGRRRNRICFSSATLALDP